MKIENFRGDTEINGYYQLVIPVLISKKLGIDYSEVLLKKSFSIVNTTQSTSDLLYFDVVHDTYKNGFTHYQFDEATNYRFRLNKANYSANIMPYIFLDLAVEDVSIFVKNSDDVYNKNDTVYFSVLVKEDSIQTDRFGKEIPKDYIIAALSQYANSCNFESTTSSYFYSDTESNIWFLHGRGNKCTILENRFNSIFEFFGVKAYCESRDINVEHAHSSRERLQHIEEFGSTINFVNGKNIFVNYFIRNERYFTKVKNAIGQANAHESHSILNNINETKYEFNIFVKDVERLVDTTFFLKWKESGSLFTIAANSFGLVINNDSTLSPSILFDKYSMAIFFALNQRVMNIELQESVKGISKNSHKQINEHYMNLEKFAFYEISSEDQIQTLFDMLQAKFRNTELTSTIMAEMEIHQTRRLNEVFERLTNYGIYLAVLGLVIAIASYFATFLGEVGTMALPYKIMSRILSDPFLLFFLCIIIYYGSILFLKKRSK